MTGYAAFNDPIARPVRDTLTVGTAHPVFSLSEMALTAHLVAVIHIDFGALLGDQKIAFFFVVTGITGQRFLRAAMIQTNLSMRHFGSVGDTDRFVIMALTAFKVTSLIK